MGSQISEIKNLTKMYEYLFSSEGPFFLKMYRSAPAHESILLMRMTWNGWIRTRIWKPSLPIDFTRCLLAQIRPASSASEDSYNNGSISKWWHKISFNPEERIFEVVYSQNKGAYFLTWEEEKKFLPWICSYKDIIYIGKNITFEGLEIKNENGKCYKD